MHVTLPEGTYYRLYHPRDGRQLAYGWIDTPMGVQVDPRWLAFYRLHGAETAWATTPDGYRLKIDRADLERAISAAS